MQHQNLSVLSKVLSRNWADSRAESTVCLFQSCDAARSHRLRNLSDVDGYAAAVATTMPGSAPMPLTTLHCSRITPSPCDSVLPVSAAGSSDRQRTRRLSTVVRPFRNAGPVGHTGSLSVDERPASPMLHRLAGPSQAAAAVSATKRTAPRAAARRTPETMAFSDAETMLVAMPTPNSVGALPTRSSK